MLVQYRLSKVFSPVGEMRQSLLWEGALALISILIVSGTLWFLVQRAGEQRAGRRRRLVTAGDAPSDQNPSRPDGPADGRSANLSAGPADKDTSLPSPAVEVSETLPTPDQRDLPDS